ncbi:unnamed protein product [Rodentolepis nana]|uniref:ANK_REP_REGION domain-containing protein n=1 Tax=Rodentolepis nana TaxID=102285 RepID=A0A0R3TSF6_RODNA|nr:unnamed protein product [Rodentolepis nana]
MVSDNDGSPADKLRRLIAELNQGPIMTDSTVLELIRTMLRNRESQGQVFNLSQQIFDALIEKIIAIPLNTYPEVIIMSAVNRLIKVLLHRDEDVRTIVLFQHLSRVPQFRHRLIFVIMLVEYFRRNFQYDIMKHPCIHETILCYINPDSKFDILEMTKYLELLFDLLAPQYKSRHYFALVYINEQVWKYPELLEKIIQAPSVITNLLLAYNQTLMEKVIWKDVNKHAFLHEMLPLFESFKSKKGLFEFEPNFILDCVAGLYNERVLAFIEPQYRLVSTLSMMLLNNNLTDVIASGLCILEKIIFNLSKMKSKVISSNEGEKVEEPWDESDVFIKELRDFLQVRSAIDAIQNQDMDTLNEMLNKGLDVQQCDSRGQSIFQWICSFGNPEIVKRLCSKMSMSVQNYPMALHSAMQLGRLDICRILFEYFTFHSDAECNEFMERVNHLVNTCIAHDNGTIIEPSLLLVNELLKSVPSIYGELVARYRLHDATNRARTLQALKLLEPTPTPIPNAPERISYLWHGWTISPVNELLIIHNDNDIISLNVNYKSRFLKGYFLSSDIDEEVKMLGKGSPPVEIKGKSHTDGLKYKLLCLVDFIQRKYSQQQLDEVQSQNLKIKMGKRASQRPSPMSSRKKSRKMLRNEITTTNSTENSYSIPTFSSEGTLLKANSVNLAVIKSENGDKYLRVQLANGCNHYGLLLPPSIKQGFVHIISENSPMYRSNSNEESFSLMIDNTVFHKLYQSKHSETPRPKLCSIRIGKNSVHTKADLKEIANEMRAKDTEDNQESILHRLQRSFESLGNILSDRSNYITPIEVLTSGIVPALLECLSMSCCDCWGNKVIALFKYYL